MCFNIHDFSRRSSKLEAQSVRRHPISTMIWTWNYKNCKNSTFRGVSSMYAVERTKKRGTENLVTWFFHDEMELLSNSWKFRIKFWIWRKILIIMSNISIESFAVPPTWSCVLNSKAPSRLSKLFSLSLLNVESLLSEKDQYFFFSVPLVIHLLWVPNRV